MSNFKIQVGCPLAPLFDTHAQDVESYVVL